MNERLIKIEAVLDKMDSRLDSIDQTLVRNTTSLEIHVKRTDLLQEELIPIKEHVALMTYGGKTIIWLGGILAGLAAFAYTLKELNLF